MKEIPPLYETGQDLIKGLAIIGILGFAASVAFLLLGKSCSQYSAWAIGIGIFWALAPPIWFFFEYFYYFPKHGKSDASLESLSAAQDVSARVWAAFLAVLAAILTKLFPS